jgi:hypothetical protein
VKLNNQERDNDIHCEMKCGIKWLISHNDAGWILNDELNASERCDNVHYVLKCVIKWSGSRQQYSLCSEMCNEMIGMRQWCSLWTEIWS